MEGVRGVCEISFVSFEWLQMARTRKKIVPGGVNWKRVPVVTSTSEGFARPPGCVDGGCLQCQVVDRRKSLESKEELGSYRGHSHGRVSALRPVQGHGVSGR